MKNRIVDELVAAGWGTRQMEELGKTFEEAEEVANQSFKKAQKAVEQFATDHPALCIGMAIAAGITLGYWVKRK